MENWMASANGKIYDHASSFQKRGFIDWRQYRNYSIGDYVYIYCTNPIKRVMYKTVVVRESMVKEQIVDDREFWKDDSEYKKGLSADRFARLELVEQVDTPMLDYEHLKKHGLTSAPQGPIKISDELVKYIDKYMNDMYSEGRFPEEISSSCHEGAVKEITVNRYERSSIARRKCIEYHGCYCNVCGFDFEKVYGELGRDFIHVHHVIPLSEINEKYVIDYKEDLVPVCPNCHAMLHRNINGKAYTVEELKTLLSE
jgi:5-methylcytosine-specific restriction protein A